MVKGKEKVFLTPLSSLTESDKDRLMEKKQANFTEFFFVCVYWAPSQENEDLKK